jgi:hypothetical protein
VKIDNIKQEVTYDMENLRKKNKIEMQIKIEGHNSRLEQAEDRLSELKNEMVIKQKTEELLVKLKTIERNMQEFTDSFKRPNLRIMSIEKEKRCKQKELVMFSRKSYRKFPKSS